MPGSGSSLFTSRNCSMPGTSWSPIWRTTHRRRRPGPTRPARPVRAPPRPSASCDAPPRKDARRAPLAPARRRGPEGGRRSPDTARLWAADRVQAHSCGSASHRRTRGDVAGRRGRTRARVGPDRASRPGRRAPSAHATAARTAIPPPSRFEREIVLPVHLGRWP